MREIAIFGAGCFWGVEESFRILKGVLETEVGYCGGDHPSTDYRAVCTGTTNHAEVVRIEFDPSVIRYKSLLDKFWRVHNPTTLNQQGPDYGTQYRSVIFFTTEEQEKEANHSLKELINEKRFANPVVTQVVKEFHYVKGEEYHQKYLLKQGKTTCGL